MTGKRSRGVGKLRPSVVLYNEDHKDGEHVGEVVRKDLTGSSPRADLLLVVGTSLRVPGTKRIVREFSKAVRLRATKANANTNATTEGDLQTPTSSPRRSPVINDEGPITSVYLNLDFPVPTRDWEGVFDVWLKGDAQHFAMAIEAELEKADAMKQAALDRKRKREAAAALAALGEVQIEPPPKKQKLSRKKPSKPPLALPSIDRLPSPADEESDSSQRKITIKIPPLSQGHAPPAPSWKRHKVEVVIEKRSHSLVYSSPSHGQHVTQSQVDLKGAFPVTMGRATAKVK